jgi:serine/threonine-protein kinase RsbW
LGGKSILALRTAANALRERQEEFCQRASDRCFEELASYKFGTLPRSESRATVQRLWSYVVKSLESDGTDDAAASHEGEVVHEDAVSVERGIAAQRVRMSIQFEDLIRGMQIMRHEVWNCLREAQFEPDAAGVFELERKVNDIFDAFFLGLSSSYRQSQAEVVRDQERALEQWEEVVRSASEIRLKIPCREEFAKIVRVQAEAIARRVAFTEDEIYDIITAVGEVCDNSIEHGGSEQGIDIQYFLSPGEFKVEVQDYGVGFDPEAQGFEPPDLFSEDGRGLFLMKNLMDVVEIESHRGKGTRVVIAKFRNPPAV